MTRTVTRRKKKFIKSNRNMFSGKMGKLSPDTKR